MNRQLSLSLVIGLVAMNAGVDTCRAQWSFNFGYSEGYHGHHHHHHPHWYGASWYYRPYVDYVYLAPPPTVYFAPAVTPMVPVQPALSAVPTPASTASTSTTASKATASPIVRSNALPAYSGPGVTIRNPPSSGGKVAFVVDERTEMELAPGESAPLKDKAGYTVTFDRGGDFGTTHRVLGEGTYEFVVAEKGWELRREALDAAAPNLPTVRRNELPVGGIR